MIYETPELRVLGTFTGLTMGTGGSCPDGAARNNTQLGGGALPDNECGPGTGGSG